MNFIPDWESELCLICKRICQAIDVTVQKCDFFRKKKYQRIFLQASGNPIRKRKVYTMKRFR